MKNKRHTILICLLLILFLTIGYMVRNSAEGIWFDEPLMEAIHNNTNPLVLNVMRFISFIGSEKFLFPAVGLVIIVSIINRRYFISKFLLFNTLGSFLFNHLLKQIFQRTRPFEFALVEQGGLSYPSGHSMVVMSMYLAIAYLLTRKVRDSRKKKRVYLVTSFFILLMGISRIYLGVHWPTDIIGGFIMGYVFYSLGRYFIRE
ncbi:MAG: phosphatase PAP2 family protein [Tissierellaceae bacterium]|jgi:undecaprenyl-diphosphatase|nr:phosphatase PAP2 family protein [Tissierellia bacterium]